MSTGPYRQEPSGPRYVCLVCYAHASVAPGLCPRCEVDLLPLERADVRQELRAEAERRMQGRMYSEYFGVSMSAFLVALPVLPFLGGIVYVAAALGTAWVGTRIYGRVRPRSALAVYATRKARIEAASTPRSLPARAASSTGADPEELDLLETLAWLGVRQSDPQRK